MTQLNLKAKAEILNAMLEAVASGEKKSAGIWCLHGNQDDLSQVCQSSEMSQLAAKLGLTFSEPYEEMVKDDLVFFVDVSPDVLPGGMAH